MIIPEPNAWTKIPSTSDVLIYPIIRKPSITCSSSFILKTSRQIIIIDPGGDHSQIEQIRHVVMRVLNELPVYIFLTHCHVDHFLAMSPLLGKDVRAKLVLHAIAAHAIEEKDEHITMANMIDAVLPECKVYGKFFEAASLPATPGKVVCPFVLEDSKILLPDGRYIPAQSFYIGEMDLVEVFHTPGHSPDSVSYRIGPCMFSGDLHLATTPGIVGLAGWDSGALVTSLEALIKKGKQENIELVMPGHGVPLPFEKAEKVFRSVCKEALTLSDLATLDRERAEYLSGYAVVLLEEAGNIFSIIAARLLKVSHYLELLEEEEGAREVLQALDISTIDKIIDEFYYFTAEVKEGGVPLISKAVQFARSVDKVFAPEKVNHFFDKFLLRRLKSLLSDFINAAYGIRFRNQDVIFDMNLAVSELLAALRETPHESETIFDSIEDDRQFLTELTKRLAYEPIFSGMKLNFEPSGKWTSALADRTIFQDMVCALLEQFAVSGAGSVTLRIEVEDECITLVLSEDRESGFNLRDSKLLYLRHSMENGGGQFILSTNNNKKYYNFRLPSAESR